MGDLLYKISSEHKYPTNYLECDDNEIGVEFVMNGLIYLCDKKGGKLLHKISPLDCIEFHVSKKVDETVDGYGWGQNGLPSDQRKSWKPLDIIIYPKSSDVGMSRETPQIVINSSESQIFRNTRYREYGYTTIWNETKSGICFFDYGYSYYKPFDYWIKDKHYKKTKRSDGNGYFYDSNNIVNEARLIESTISEIKYDISYKHIRDIIIRNRIIDSFI